jgi:hypothetical protein
MTKLHLPTLLAQATTRTGLTDFGPDDFLAGLERLIGDLNEGGFVPGERMQALNERLLRLLSNRLWLERDWREHPEIAAEEIRAPLEIVSLARTGSTKLHRLLAASGDFQYLPMWKTHMFARIPGLAAGGESRRIGEVREYESWMLQVSPDIRTGHPMFTDEAEEDQWLMECTFRRVLTAIMFNAAGYAQWLAAQDPAPAYAYLHRQLQYLQWQNRQLRGSAEADKPWLLKSPDHLGCEGWLEGIFPDVRVVMTHRDPVECIPSASVMAKQFLRLYTSIDDPKLVAGALMQAIPRMAQSHLAWRKSTAAPMLDLGFRQITADGPGAARGVYDFLGMELSSRAEQAMQAWEQDNQQDKHGKNQYSLEVSGSTAAGIREVFRGYTDRYSQYF